MDTKMFTFRWPINNFHLTWDGRGIILNSDDVMEGNKESWSFQESPDLFLAFAHLDSTNEQEIVLFARKYGLLGTMYERLGDWQTEIEALRGAVNLWMELRKENWPMLASMVKWNKKDKRVTYSIGKGFGIWGAGILPVPFSRHNLSQDMEKKDLEVMGWEVLRHLINIGLSDCNPQIEWDRGKLRLSFNPRNLLGALWLQFALAVSGDWDFNHCEYCGRPFLLTPSINRTNRRYCKNSCKNMAYRQRVKGKGKVLFSPSSREKGRKKPT